MILAELRGKLGTDYSHAHDRSEDLLTSTVFGLLRYLLPKEGILPILKASRWVDPDQSPSKWSLLFDPSQLAEVSSVTYELWPSFGVSGEPDVLLTLTNDRGATIHRVVVEVKLWSGKSSFDDPENDDLSSSDQQFQSKDQLAKYWTGLCARSHDSGDAVKTIVYLTAHSSPPIAELRDSMKYCRDIRLGWLSWSDVCQVLSRDGPKKSQIVNDLVDLLEYKGFGPFRGFTMPTVQLNETDGSFWQASNWFQYNAQMITTAGTTSFWRDNGKR